ncbi:hypothetical protein FG386_000274 [Cryptosporidium ryanae]|uniref:uncharacterized protein n=1 Tax=Cryptosporidium ryanae TaxID=515981 RepID=UPI00351A6F93|nr:hypothetical protein FG386_000274 [Cryptosporidium ryanae]
MEEKPFEVFNIETTLNSKWRVSKENAEISNDFIFTPFGILRPLVLCNNHILNQNFRLSWEYFFLRFTSKIKDEMRNGLFEILSTIKSSEDSTGSNELPVIGALSGTNITDHSIVFGILEDFLNNSNGISTITLEHEEIGIDGLNLSKIIDTIWIKIINKYVEKHNSGSDFRNKLGTKDYLNSLFDKKINSDFISDKKNTSSSSKKRSKILTKRNSNSNVLTDDNKFNFSNYLKTLSFYQEYESFQEPSKSDDFNSLFNSIFSLKQKDINDASRGFKILGDIYNNIIRKEQNYNPIVLLLPGAEYFPSCQLYQLLDVIYSLRETYRIPFVVILGISTNIAHIKRIIGQISMKRLKVITPRLLDSRTVFFKSILNQLIVEVEYIVPDFNSINKNSNVNNLSNIFLNSSSFLKDIQLTPFISSVSLRQIKDNFFQQDLCLSSSIRTIFLIFQDYFSSEELTFLIQPIDKIIQDRLSVKSKVLNDDSENVRIVRKSKKVQDIFKNELIDFRDTILKIRLGIYFINIIIIELDLNSINDRYNQLINWLELIECCKVFDIEKKIKLFEERIRGIVDFEKKLKPIFKKMNIIVEVLFSKHKFERKKNTSSELFNWTMETFRKNLSKLFIYKNSNSYDTLKYGNKFIFNLFDSLNHFNRSYDIYIDKLINPVYLFDTFEKLINLNYEQNTFIDYFAVYQLLKSIKDQNINLYDLLILFFNFITDNRARHIHSMKTNEEILKENFTFVNKCTGFSFSKQERYLIERYMTILSTFQLIGIISIYKKMGKRSVHIKDESRNFEDIKYLNRKNNNNKSFFDVFKYMFDDIYARKIHWSFLETYDSNKVFDKKDRLDSDQSNMEEIDLECDITTKNRKHSKSDIISIEKIDKVSKKDLNIKNSNNKRTLETVKRRAAEINLKQISKFRGIIKQKTVNSANIVKELRNLNRLKAISN